MKQQRITRVLVFILVLAAGVAAAGSATAAPLSGERAPATSARTEVTLYVMPQCGYCARARQLLTERGVTWTERDIANSAEAKREFIAKGGVGTPLIVIGEAVVSGFDASRINATLSAHGFPAK